MRATISALAALLAGIFLIMIGGGLQGTLLGVRASIAEFDPRGIGVIMSSYYVGYLAGSLMAPRLIAKVGHIRLFAAMASLASLAPLVHAIAVLPSVWLLMRLLTGVALACIFVIAESWLNDRSDNSNRGRVLSLYQVCCLGGLAAGQFLLMVADPASFVPFVIVSVLFSLSVLPIALSSRPVPAFELRSSIAMRELYRLAPLAVVGIFLVSIAYGAFYGMGAVFAVQSGMSAAQVSLFMAAGIIGSVIGQWPLGLLSDRYDRRRLIIIASFTAAAIALLLVLAPHFPALGYVAIFGFGFTSLTLYSVFVAHANDCLPAQQMVGAASRIILINGAGAALGPLAVSALAVVDIAWTFPLVLAAVHLAAGAYGLRLLRARPELGEAQTAAHHLVGQRASPVAIQINAEISAGEKGT